MNYKGTIIKVHYTLAIKTQLDTHSTIKSVKISETHKIYNPTEYLKSLTAKAQDNSIAVAHNMKSEVKEQVRKESNPPPIAQQQAPPEQPKTKGKARFTIIDVTKMDEFATKLRKNAKKMKLEENFKLTVDDIIDFEQKSLSMEFCEAFDKELDSQISYHTSEADTKNVKKCQQLQLAANRFKNQLEKGFEREQLTMDDYVGLLMQGLMRDINLSKFFSNCKFPEALEFVLNRKAMLEAEYKVFKDNM